MKKFKNSRLSTDSRKLQTLALKTQEEVTKLLNIRGRMLGLRASLCKILISSFAHKMDFAHNFSVDFF